MEMDLQPRERVKICAISGRANRSTTIPKKMFFWAPRVFGTKQKDYGFLQQAKHIYIQASRFVVCKDHFDLTEDTEYMKSDLVYEH